MKKSVKIFLILLCLCPILLLTACTSPATYLITAVPSDSSLGVIQGAYNNEQLSEGTNITLIATEKQETALTNPFICWVKDYKTVVSTEKELSLTYSQSTAGNYTAVFNETSQNKMMFASINKINCSVEGYSTINYTIKYARVNSGSSDFIELENGSYTNGQEYNTNNTSLIYFGNAGANYEYKIQIDFVFVTATGGETSYSVSFTDLVNKESFNNSGKTELTEQIEILDSSVTLTFQKLNSTMF